MKKRKLRGWVKLVIIGACMMLAIHIIGICIETVVNAEQIHEQIEEEVFNNTYGKNITVVPEVTK